MNRPTSRLALLLTVVVILPASLGAASIPAEEYAERRARLAEVIGPHGIAVLLPEHAKHRNGDVDWPFRQDDSLLYLTGIDQHDTALALVPSEKQHSEVLFLLDRDPLTEVWNGRLLSREEATAVSGIAEVASADRLERFLDAAFDGLPWGETKTYRYYRPVGLPRIHSAARAGLATLWLDLEFRTTPQGEETPEQHLAAELRQRYPEIQIRDLSPHLQALRELKSPAERQLLQRAVDITVEALEASMRRAKTATHEYQVEATVEHGFRDRGACCWGYPSIVAGGFNATTLHYNSNNDPLDRDGLLLMDVGAEVEGYTADITRTFPVDGTFSAPQREIYQAVLAAFDECLATIRPGILYLDVHEKAIEVLGRELLALGLVTEASREQTEMYYLHGVGHPIGLQVHDAFDRSRKLEVGMVWTLEPGVYVRRADVEASATFQSLGESDQAKIRRALERYHGIGVRIEDDLWIGPEGAEVMSKALPRTVEAIEAFMAGE
ncbi:MAG: aminopeptidase P family protein [Acidobacteriota bacterium]